MRKVYRIRMSEREAAMVYAIAEAYGYERFGEAVREIIRRAYEALVRDTRATNNESHGEEVQDGQ